MPLVSRGKGGLLLAAYSIPGAGKTLMAAALMWVLLKRTGKMCLYRDWENGETAIPGWIPFDLWQPDPEKDIIDEATEATQLGLAGDYAAVVDDTISTLGRRILLSTVAKDLTEGKETKRVAVKTTGGADIRVPARMDYNAAQLTFEQWALANQPLLTQGKHWMWCAHERLLTVEDAGGVAKDIVGGPEIVGGQLTRSAPKLPQVIGRIKVQALPEGGVSRLFQTEVDGYYISKDRLRVLNPRGIRIDVQAKDTTGPEDLTEKIILKCAAIWEKVLDSRLQEKPKEEQ